METSLAAAEPSPDGFDGSKLPAAGNFGAAHYFMRGGVVFVVDSRSAAELKNAVGAWRVRESGNTVKFVGRAFGGISNFEYNVAGVQSTTTIRHRAFSYLTADMQRLMYSDTTKVMQSLVAGRSTVTTKAGVQVDVVELEVDSKTPFIKPMCAIVDIKHTRYVNDPALRCSLTLKGGVYKLSLLFDIYALDVSNSIGFDDILALRKRKNMLDIESKARDAGPTKSQLDVQTIESAVVGNTYTGESGRATFSKRAGALLVKVWTGHRGGDLPDAVFNINIGVDRVLFSGPRGDIGRQHTFSIGLSIVLGDPLAIMGSSAVHAAQPNATVANAISLVELALASAEPRTQARDFKVAWRNFVQEIGNRKIKFSVSLDNDSAVLVAKQFDFASNVAVTGDFKSGMHTHCIVSIDRHGNMDAVVTANMGYTFVLREESAVSKSRIEATDRPSDCLTKLIAFIREMFKQLEPKINDPEQHVSFG